MQLETEDLRVQDLIEDVVMLILKLSENYCLIIQICAHYQSETKMLSLKGQQSYSDKAHTEET